METISTRVHEDVLLISGFTLDPGKRLFPSFTISGVLDLMLDT